MEINSRLNSDPYHNHVYTFTFNIIKRIFCMN